MDNTIIYDAQGNIIDVCYSYKCKCIECVGNTSQAEPPNGSGQQYPIQ